MTFNKKWIGPSREFVFAGKNISDLGLNGKNAYEKLFSMIEGDRIVNDQINLWIERFGYDLIWKSSGPNKGQLMLVGKESGTETNIMDDGFGIGQSLPVIIKMVSFQEGNMLIDSPEAFYRLPCRVRRLFQAFIFNIQEEEYILCRGL